MVWLYRERAKAVIWLMCAFIGLSALTASAARGGGARRIAFGGADPSAVAPSRPVAITAKGAARVDLVAAIPFCDLTSITMQDGNDYSTISIPGVTIPGTVGDPERPTRAELIRVTPGSAVSLVVGDGGQFHESW